MRVCEWSFKYYVLLSGEQTMDYFVHIVLSKIK